MPLIPEVRFIAGTTLRRYTEARYQNRLPSTGI
jgi:hypothetical protein